jgi:hypothetical protein
MASMAENDAALEARQQVTNYLRYAIENARSALTLMGEPATTEAATDYVLVVLATMATE